MPSCLASGAHYTGQGTQGGANVSFWRQMTGPFARVDLIVNNNSTDMSAVVRVATVSEAGSAVTELFNYNTNPIDPSAFALPSLCT